MNTGLMIALAAGAAYGIWAFFNDKSLWRNKPRAVLEEMITGGNWTTLQVALEEVKRRGENIQPYRHIVLKMLISESKIERVAGKVAIQKLYPEVAGELQDYEGTAPTDVSVAKGRLIVERFGAPASTCDATARDKTRVMTFQDSTLQQHYDSAVAFERDCPPEERPVRALIDAYYRFEIEDGTVSARVREITERVLAPELRPVLRSWYRRMGAKIHGDAIKVRERLGKLAGESLG